MKLSCALLNGAWAAAQAPRWWAFRRALEDPRVAQVECFERILRANARTAYGERHGLPRVRDLEDFRRRVPLVDWRDLEDDLRRVAAGEPAVLTGQAVRHLAWTGGSTGGAKRVPYTRGLLREFQDAIGPWIAELMRTRPALLGGPAYWSVTPLASAEEQAESAVPVGFEEDTEYLGGWAKRLVDGVMAVPGSMRREREVARFRHLTALFLLRARELRLISVWHPSFLSLLLDELARGWEGLLRDVHDGVAGSPHRALRRGDPRRARELAALGPREPAKLWPALALVSCWEGAHAALGAAELRRRLPGIELQPKGLIATEAFVSLPFGGAHPLALRSHLFEFERPDGELCLAHELERGEQVGVIVTTSGGLWRYRLGDRVRVEGFLRRTPSIAFVGRLDRRADLRGEKLDEGFVGAAIAELLRETGVEAPFAMLVPEAGDPAPRYCLRVEAPPARLPELARGMERLLHRNPHYAHCVRLGQLQPCGARAVEDGYAGYLEECGRRGQRLGDVKPPALMASRSAVH